jgi:hypothetical protein
MDKELFVGPDLARLRYVDWTLLGQVEFGRAELRHSNYSTFGTCILRFVDFFGKPSLIGRG